MNNKNKIEKKDRALLKPMFWDTYLSYIDLVKNRRAVIERLLHFGRPEHIQWVLQHYSVEDIIETIKESKSIDRRTANYWTIHFNIPQKDVLCLNRQLIDDYFY